MTTSGGTHRPTPSEAQDAPTQVNAPAVGPAGAPQEAPRPASTSPASPDPGSVNGSGSSDPRLTGGYDVAAALRAQASRAAAATRTAAQRVQEAMAPTPVDPDEGSGRSATATAVVPPAEAATGTAGGRSTPAHAPTPPPARPAVAAPAQAYATGPGPATARPATRPPEASSEPTRSRVAPTAAPAPAPRRTGRVRKARLRLLRLDPWSVMKTAFLLSVAMGIMLFVAVAVLWSVLDAAGVFSAVGDVVRDVTASETSAGIDIEGFVAMSRVLGFTTLVAVVDVVLVTALATLGAFLYNLSASLLGGLEVTLAEDD